MNKTVIYSFAFIALFWGGQSALSEDLLSVYHQGVMSYPGLHQQRDASRSLDAASSSARGALLPTLSGVGAESLNRTYFSKSQPVYFFSTTPVSLDGIHSNTSFEKRSLNATISMPLFNLPVWLTYWNAHKLADAGDATYTYQQQQFMGSLAKAYFNVLLAKATLAFDQSNIDYLQKMLIQAKEKYKVGLKTESDVQQARTDYFRAKAKYIRDKSGYAPTSSTVPSPPSLTQAIEQLRQYTGKKYDEKTLKDIKSSFPFVNPTPASIEYWVNQAKMHNQNLLSARQTSRAAHATARASYAVWIPQVSVSGSYAYARYSNQIAAQLVGKNKGDLSTKSSQVALNLVWNIFSGGSNFASAFKAASTYQAQLANERGTYRQTMNDVRQDYLTMIKDTSTIEAYKQAVISATSSVNQYEAQYQVGTKDITDLLLQVQFLYQQKQKLSEAKYQYINDYLTLRIASGLITLADLKYLNGYLA